MSDAPLEQEFFVNLQTMLKYRKVSNNSTHIIIRPAFSTHAEETELSWGDFFEQYKPLREGVKENDGHA